MVPSSQVDRFFKLFENVNEIGGDGIPNDTAQSFECINEIWSDFTERDHQWGGGKVCGGKLSDPA